MATVPANDTDQGALERSSMACRGRIDHPETVVKQVLRIAETHPDVRDIVERWLHAKLPLEQSLVQMIRELSERLAETESAFRAVLRALRDTDPP